MNIHPSIQLEKECPSMHGDSKLPLLDVKMWVTTLERKRNPAQPRELLTHEVLRILLRCSPDLPWADVKSHVATFMQMMQFSGYEAKFKGVIVKSAFKAYREVKEKDGRGEQPLYRPKMWNRVDRQNERRMKKTNWFKRKGCDFCETCCRPCQREINM